MRDHAPRGSGLLLGIATLSGGAAACTDGRDPPSAAPPTSDERAGAPAAAADPVAKAQPSNAADGLAPLAAKIEAHALECAGRPLATALDGLSPEQRGELARHEDTPSARLAAHWANARRFADDGTLAPEAAPALAALVAEITGRPPPQWWIEQLASARRSDAVGPTASYDTALTPAGASADPPADRRGPRVKLEGGVMARPGMIGALGVSGGRLFVDLSMGRVDLGPAPTDPGRMVELARAPGGSTTFLATFEPGAGGFRFPLRAVDGQGRQRWEAEVCGPDRQLLGGLGHLTVQIVPIAAPSEAPPGTMPGAIELRAVAVFTAESHGVALDLFDPETGKHTLAWSSELWFAGGS